MIHGEHRGSFSLSVVKHRPRCCQSLPFATFPLPSDLCMQQHDRVQHVFDKQGQSGWLNMPLLERLRGQRAPPGESSAAHRPCRLNFPYIAAAFGTVSWASSTPVEAGGAPANCIGSMTAAALFLHEQPANSMRSAQTNCCNMLDLRGPF